MSDQRILDLREVGATGLRRFSGFIYEEFLTELTGWRGVAVYKEMTSNDPTITAILFAIKMLCKRVPWRVDPASQNPVDMQAAEFVESCMNDMSHTWLEMIDEILSMLSYGFSVHELVYKRRCGDGLNPSMRSKYADGRIGWRKISIRSQDSIYRWQFDDHGGIQGVEQLAPPHYYHTTIPIEKMLLFRTTIEKNNPEGRSMFRGAYRPWYLKKNIENIEGIGVERDLAGLPVALVPPEILSTGASDAEKQLKAAIQDIVVNIRRDAQEGVLFPQVYDQVSGKPLYELKLLSTGGQRQFDTDKIVQRYDQRIAMTALADFILLGQDKVGSFALANSKTNLFSTAIGAYLDIVSEVFNRYAIPRLFAFNDFAITEHPKITHGDLEAVDLKELGDYITKLAQAGYPLFPNQELEKYLMKVANLPEPPEMMKSPSLQVQVPGGDGFDETKTIPFSPIQLPSGLNVTADTTPVNGAPPPPKVVTNASGGTERNSYQNNNKETEESLKNPKGFQP